MLRKVSLPDHFTRGKLYLSSMPGRYEPLRVFLDGIEEAGVTHIGCLVSDEEIARKSPDYLSWMGRDDVPATFHRLEISDYGIPGDVDAFDRMLDLIRERLDAHESVVIHCAAGHGRTGMVSSLLLVRMGLPLDEAVATIADAGSAPDTAGQREFVGNRVAAWQRNPVPR